MNALEQAQNYLNRAQYAKFFAFVKSCIGENATLAELQMTFVQNKMDIHFAGRLTAFIDLHKSELIALPSALFLTYCPTRQDFIGRQEELLHLHAHLEAHQTTVVVNDLGRIGKTSLACEYIKQYEHIYMHVVWLEQITSLLNAFIDCYDLTKDFHFTKESETIRFQTVLHKLAECTGKNLLVVDNFQIHKLDKTLHTLAYFATAQMRHWKIFFTSREKIAPYQHLNLDTLPKKDAIALFKMHCTEKEVNKTDLKVLLHEIGYHTLLIELLAKIYNTHKDLQNLPTLTAKMQQKALNGQALQDKKWTAHSQEEIALYDYLLRIFKIETLDENARYILKQFAVLPAEAQSYERFLDQIGDKDRIHRKTLAELVKKRWLACPTKQQYHIHRLVQMLMLYLLQLIYQNCVTLHNTVENLLSLDEINANHL